MRAAGLALATVIAAAAAGGPASGQDGTGDGPGVLDAPGQKSRPGSPAKEERESVIYSGLGLSRVVADFENVKEAVNLDLAIGFRVPVIRVVSAEVDASFTIVPGEYTGPQECTTTSPSPPPPLGSGDPGGTTCEPGNFTRATNGLQMTNVGLFGVVRTPGVIYAVGKYGYRIINVSIPEIMDGDDVTGTAWQAGAGFRWSQGLAAAELAYTDYSSQLEYWGFNIAYGFGASPERGGGRIRAPR